MKKKAFSEYLKLEKYAYLIKYVRNCVENGKKVNDNSEEAQDFQKEFNGFYEINAAIKGKAWKIEFYNVFQETIDEFRKKEKIDYEESLNFFKELLNKLLTIDDKHEILISFASKIVATINPKMIIVDKNVLCKLKNKIDEKFSKEIKIDNNGHHHFVGNYENKIENAVKIYEEITYIENKMIRDNKDTINKFKEYYRECRNECFENKELEDVELEDIKILDFFLWKL